MNMRTMINDGGVAMSEIDEAKIELEQLFAAYEALEGQRDGMRIALNVAEYGLNPDTSDDFKAKAAVYQDRVKRNARRARIDVEDLTIELEQMGPALHAAREKYRELLTLEADRFAQGLVARHRVAVAALVKTHAAFSAALEAEAAIQIEFVNAMPQNPQSGRIPNMSHHFNNLRLDFPDSFGAAWAGAARAVLDR